MLCCCNPDKYALDANTKRHRTHRLSHITLKKKSPETILYLGGLQFKEKPFLIFITAQQLITGFNKLIPDSGA